MNKTDKRPKKDEDGECQGFLEKYYPRYEGGDFFKNPQGLTNPDEELPFLSVWFISVQRDLFLYQGKGRMLLRERILLWGVGLASKLVTGEASAEELGSCFCALCCLENE